MLDSFEIFDQIYVSFSSVPVCSLLYLLKMLLLKLFLLLPLQYAASNIWTSGCCSGILGLELVPKTLKSSYFIGFPSNFDTCILGNYVQ